MKILQLIHKPQLRGAEIFAAQLTDNLETKGHCSKILAIYESPDALKYNRNYLSINANPKSSLWDRAGWKALADKIAAEKPDIVQANAGDTLKYAVFSKLLFRWQQPLVFRNASTLSSYLKKPLQKAYTRFLFNHTDAVASVSEYSRQDLVGLFPSLDAKTKVIPIGLEKKVEVKDPFPGSSPERVNLVHVGGFSFEKNHRGLLRIFKATTARLPQVHLWLVGDGPMRAEIEALVAEMGLQEQVHFTGFVQNPLDYIAHGQALLLPSIIEGLPGVILEAMLYKTPVVAYKVGGVGEVVRPGETGWLVEPGDEQGFTEAIGELIKNSDKSKGIVEHAFRQVNKKYMNEGIAASFVHLYEGLLRSNPA
ncbi:glycosyltransferase involved in cell wall biosynthesis [Pontibacter ummariensis]|uniref:Glycosyltransferase involved in cell wall bisynthesis n=1 Tax=Pontibacter ummariensis TaxID=1610492 RepID=A0A239EJR7_9BACT|nr:glycosyltransferase [Pontibacter ummariensis]PRY13303.1 glycosyltransferase involved in cell wall biosynthesis [Pontibacter ummariensis]SNS45010.1 Glycosyltransferase involved in cell wall bisynthesis [Pontibacter ummariensis]